MVHNALSNNNSNLRISSDGDEGWMGRLTANIAWIFTNVDIWELSSDNSNIHPIIQVKEMGDRMIFSAITAIGVVVAATAGISGLVGVVSTSAAVSGAAITAPFAFTIFFWWLIGNGMVLGLLYTDDAIFNLDRSIDRVVYYGH